MRRTGWTMALAMAGVTAVMAGPAGAQQVEWAVAADDERCDRSWGDRDRDRHCEVREATLPFDGSVTVDGGGNGGIEVAAWDRDEVRVAARVQAHARSGERALEIARQVRLVTSGGDLRADGPDTGRGEGWAVSWEVTVPRSADLRLETRNGGISVEGVHGSIDFDAVNGGVHLVGVGGDVRGETTNGGLHVELAGDRWDGRGLDARTTNGGVRVLVPDGYSAELETGTVNGGIDVDFPVMVEGRVGRSLRTTLGDGGPTIRLVTTNGGVRIQRR